MILIFDESECHLLCHVDPYTHTYRYWDMVSWLEHLSGEVMEHHRIRYVIYLW